MRFLVLVLGAVLALTACQTPAGQGPGTELIFQLNRDELQRASLTELSTKVREEFRRAPLIALRPQAGGAVEAGHLRITLGKAEEAPAAMERLGRIDMAEISNPLVISQENGNLELRFTDTALDKLEADLLPASVEILKRRLDAAGVQKPGVETRGSVIRVHVPPSEDISGLVELLTSAGVLTLNIVDGDANPSDYDIGIERNGRIALPNDGLGGQPQVVFVEPIVRGEDINSASSSYDQSNQPSIAFQLKPAATQKFGRATSQNVGRAFAIIFDGRIISAPRIMSPITTSNGQITGAFTPEEAEDMAVILRSGALPAPLKLLKREVVTE